MFVSKQLWKTLETTDGSLSERLTVPDIDVTSLFQVDKEEQKPAVDVEKQKTERYETESFYLKVSAVVTLFCCFKWSNSNCSLFGRFV